MASHLSLSVMSMMSSSPAGYFHGSCAARPELLARYGLVVAAGGAPPPRHGKALALAVPARLVAKGGGRLAAAVAAAAKAPPGEGGDDDDDDLPFVDCEAAVSAFRMQMQIFRLSQRPLAFVSTPSDPLLEGAFRTAKDCTLLVEFLLAKVPVHRDILKEVIAVGQALLIVEIQAKEGYVKADALVNVIQGLKLIGNTFFKGVGLPKYYSPTVPLSADDVVKDSFFIELINLFVVFNISLSWEARNKYGFGSVKAN